MNDAKQKAKHTPGPWLARDIHFQRDFRTFVNVSNGEGSFVACVSADPMQHDNIEANARLIAAAPELLAALKDAAALLEYVGDQVSEQVLQRKEAACFAAIAKAEGRS